MINWDLYKGRDTEKGKKAYIGFCELLESENYKLEGNYVNARIKIELQCNKGHRYSVAPSQFKSGRRCPICSGRDSEIAKLDFIKQVEKEGYKVLGEYKNTSSKIELQCNKCHRYLVTPQNFKQGKRCPVCSGKSKEQAKKDFEELVKNEGYKVLGKYVNTKTKVEVKCDKGHRYFVRPNDFKRGYRCPVCSGLHSETAKLEFIKQVESEGYKIIGEYVNSYTKIELQCDKGHRYSVKPNDFKSCQRCPHCGTISHGENLTKEVLKEYNCRFETQKKFRGLVGLKGGQLSYDFFVDDCLLIEIQGEQHFKPTAFGGRSELESIEAFKQQQQEHDRLKREFAKENGYELLEMPYFGIGDLDKLEQILREKIEDYKHIPKAS